MASRPRRERAERRRAVRRRRRAIVALVLVAVAGVAFALLERDGGRSSASGRGGAALRARASRGTPPAPPRPTGVVAGPASARQSAKRPPQPSISVGLRILDLVDRSRQLRLPGGASGPRRLTTIVRFPQQRANVRGSTRATSGGGPYPLIVFGHGFAVTPSPYSRLLDAWTRAGYVVAAPVFPLESAHAPGGPDESDLDNQPGDMRFVISALLARSAASRGPLRDLIDPTEIAVAGQSDGGETALAIAYDKHFRDSRVRAAVILSGAQIPGPDFTFPAGGPPLLATQGTADTVNPPSLTQAFYARAPRPKYLLELYGASHLPPYTTQQPELGIVERVGTAFLDRYLKRAPGAQRRLMAVGSVPGVASLSARP
ncbi:MAG: alpha/beta hydrolase family protein [Solirubrobacteraceae bacterium]